jgi:hypothetical protein
LRRIWRYLPLLLLAGPAVAQADSITVAPGPQYAASPLRRFFFGRSYRDLWTTPARYPVLRLDGMAPTRASSGRQTRSLRLRGTDGVEYVFRSIDKDLTPGTPWNSGGSLRQRLRQDQTRAQLPGSSVVAGALLRAAGVAGEAPRLVVMPRDPRLGRFAAPFGGMLGTIEPRPEAGWRGAGAPAERVLDTDELLEAIDSSGAAPVDARAYLRARLMDVYLGDWDRHEGQLRWALVPRAGGPAWVPVPRDRDYAFVSYDGAVAAAARLFGVTGVVRFGPEYPRLAPLIRNGDRLDRRMLAELPRAAWDSVVVDLRLRLTDRVIRDAVALLPREHRAMRGSWLEASLRSRRDGLDRVASAYYRRMSREVEVPLLAAPERIEARRRRDGSLELQVRADGRLRYRRVFRAGDTQRVRLAPGPGDRATATGPRGCIWLLVSGDRGQLTDRSGGPTHAP